MELPSISELISHQKHWTEKARGFQYVLGIDPGETTGICLLDHTMPQQPILQEQIKSYPHRIGRNNLLTVLDPMIERIRAENRFLRVAMEDYRVYAWKTSDHTFSELFTPQLIGALRWYFLEQQFDVCLQMAQLPKRFVTNEKLQKWGIDPTGKTHARDATRHAVYHAIFGGSYADIK